MDGLGDQSKAGRNRGIVGKGIAWLARVCRGTGVVPRRVGGADDARPRVERDVAVIIAKRAVRVNNRAPAGAAKYERVHHILAEGMK